MDSLQLSTAGDPYDSSPIMIKEFIKRVNDKTADNPERSRWRQVNLWFPHARTFHARRRRARCRDRQPAQAGVIRIIDLT